MGDFIFYIQFYLYSLDVFESKRKETKKGTFQQHFGFQVVHYLKYAKSLQFALKAKLLTMSASQHRPEWVTLIDCFHENLISGWKHFSLHIKL